MIQLDEAKIPLIAYSSCGHFISRGEWIHPRRTIDTTEIIFVLSGKVFIGEENEEYVLEKNDMLILSPGKEHYGTKYSSGVSFFWLHFSAQDGLFSGNRANFSDCSELIGLFRVLLHDVTTPRYPLSSAYHMTCLILNEISFLSDKSIPEKSMAHRVSEYVAENASAALSTADVASHFGYNADYLSRSFRKVFGVTLKKHIDEKLVEKAKQKIQTQHKSLSDAAAELGFENENQFSKFFRYHVGITPSQYCSAHYNTHINHA